MDDYGLEWEEDEMSNRLAQMASTDWHNKQETMHMVGLTRHGLG